MELSPFITGTAAGDGDVFILGRNDLWCWESPLLEFSYAERQGPALVDLAWLPSGTRNCNVRRQPHPGRAIRPLHTVSGKDGRQSGRILVRVDAGQRRRDPATRLV